MFGRAAVCSSLSRGGVRAPIGGQGRGVVLRLRRLVALLEIASGLRGSVCWVCAKTMGLDLPGPARVFPDVRGAARVCVGVPGLPGCLRGLANQPIKREAMQGQCPVLLSSYSVPGMRLHCPQLSSIFVILCSALMCNASVFQARRFVSQARSSGCARAMARGRGCRCSLWRAAAGWNAVGSTLRVRFQAVGGEMQPWDYKEVFNGRSVVVVALTGACRSQVLCVCSRWCLCGRFRAAVARRELPRRASLLLPAWARVCVALSGQGVLASASMCSFLLGSASVCSVCLALLRCEFVWQRGLRLFPSGSLQALPGCWGLLGFASLCLGRPSPASVCMMGLRGLVSIYACHD